MTDIRAVEFEAEIRQVKTMADGTITLVQNLPETCEEQGIEFVRHAKEMVRFVAEFTR